MKSSLSTGSSKQNVTFVYVVLHPTNTQKVSEYDQKIPHNHTPKTNPRRREEEPQNTHSNNTSVRQPKKASRPLFFLKMIAKLERTQGILKQRHAQNTNKQ